MRLPAALALLLIAAGCGSTTTGEPPTTEANVGIGHEKAQAQGLANPITCLRNQGVRVNQYEPPDNDVDATWYVLDLPRNDAIIALHETRRAAREHAEMLAKDSIGYAYVSWLDDPSGAERDLLAICLDQ